MIGTRYVLDHGKWAPSYTVGDGLGDRVARLAYRAGFTQTPGCGCPNTQATITSWGDRFRRWTGGSSGLLSQDRRVVSSGPMIRRPISALPPISGGVGTPQEVACGALGAKCVCARTMRTTTGWVRSAFDSQTVRETDADPTDPKLCGYVVGDVVPVIRYDGGLPGLVAGPNGLTGVFNMDMKGGLTSVWANQPMQNRIGTRSYFQNSTDYVSTFGRSIGGVQTDCDNDKYWQMGDYWTR